MVLQRLWHAQRGFSLVESIVAIAVIGVSVVGSVVLLNTTVRTSADTEGDLGLIQVLRAQVETIQNVPYDQDPTRYPALTGIPPNISLSWESSDPGATYAYPGEDRAGLGQVVQKIVVTAAKDEATASLTFYKIKTR